MVMALAVEEYPYVGPTAHTVLGDVGGDIGTQVAHWIEVGACGIVVIIFLVFIATAMVTDR